MGGNREGKAVACLVVLAASLGTARSGPPDEPPSHSAARFLESLEEPAAVAAGPGGSIYVCEALGQRVSVFDRTGLALRHWGRFGRGEGEFDDPRGIAVGDDGRVYVSDTGNHRVEVFSADGRFESQWGRFGSNSGEFNEPLGLTVSGGLVYVADSRNDRVQVFDRNGKFVFHIWNYGSLEGAFDRPVDVAVDQDGDLYVSDQGNSRIQKFAPDGRFLMAWGGRGRQGSLLIEPHGLDLRDGRLVVADPYSDRLVAFDTAGALHDEWAAAGSGPPTALEGATDVAALPSGGDLVVCAAIEDRCQIVPRTDLVPAGTPSSQRPARDGYTVGGAKDLLVVAARDTVSLSILDLARHPPPVALSLGSPGREPLEFVRPAGFVLDPRQGTLLVSDSGNSRIQLLRLGTLPGAPARYDPSSTRFVKSIGLADQEALDRDPAGWALTPAGLEPGAIARDRRGQLVIGDTVLRRIVVLDREFRLVRSWGGFGDEQGRFRKPAGLALDPQGTTVFVLDAGQRRVQAFDLQGRFLFTWGGPGNGPAEFLAPVGIATGKDHSVYVVDRGANRVQRFDSRGRVLGMWGHRGSGPGEFLKPEGIFVDGRNQVIVIDSGNRRGQAFTPKGGFLREFSIDPATIAAGRAAAK